MVDLPEKGAPNIHILFDFKSKYSINSYFIFYISVHIPFILCQE